MKRILAFSIIGLSIATVILALTVFRSPDSTTKMQKQMLIKLPVAALNPVYPLRKALLNRKSVRKYADRPIGLTLLAELLWAAQGKTKDRHRTTPSAGGLYPIEVFVISNNVGDLAAGVYHYRISQGELELWAEAPHWGDLFQALQGQDFFGRAPALIVITGVFERSARKYGDRAERYIYIEGGAAVQNVYLAVQALDLATVVVGAFNDQHLSRILGLPAGYIPIAVMPIGWPADQ